MDRTKAEKISNKLIRIMKNQERSIIGLHAKNKKELL